MLHHFDDSFKAAIATSGFSALVSSEFSADRHVDRGIGSVAQLRQVSVHLLLTIHVEAKSDMCIRDCCSSMSSSIFPRVIGV